MDTTTENTETTNVNKNNDFPSNILNIAKFPDVIKTEEKEEDEDPEMG